VLTGLENADKLHSPPSCKAVPVTQANHPGEILRDKWLRQCQSLLVAVPQSPALSGAEANTLSWAVGSRRRPLHHLWNC
jgi:hypothetical protein